MVADHGEATNAIERGKNAGEAGGIVIARIEPGEFGNAVPLGAILPMPELAGLLEVVVLILVHRDLLWLCPLAGARAKEVATAGGCSRQRLVQRDSGHQKADSRSRSA